MDKLWGAGLAVLLVIIMFVLMGRGWQRRVRRDATSVSPELSADAEIGQVIGSWRGLYVSTSERANVLERIASPGLAFRAQATLVLGESGVVFDLRGEHATFIPLSRIDGLTTSHLTIDKVVERGGLTVIDWQLPAEVGMRAVSSFFRMSSADRDSFFETYAHLISTTQKETS
jgi:hypothetical protein